jgi:hypothetical protein
MSAGVPTKSGSADYRCNHYRAWRDDHPVGSAIAEPVAMRPGAATSLGLGVEAHEGKQCRECGS